MKQLARELESIVRKAEPKLRMIPEGVSAHKSSPGKGSAKEILGHLIDSASNNHQRFVRLQISGQLEFPDYNQQAWTQIQCYREEAWPQLIALWQHFNLHLAHLIAITPQNNLHLSCTIGDNAPATLKGLMEDYVAHLRHHLVQIFGEDEFPAEY